MIVLISEEILINLAREETESRARTEDVISGYLIGSVARGEAILRGTADIDLVLIHRHEPARTCEYVPLSDDVHLEITHHSISLYQDPPKLRVDPWLGPSMCEPIFLYDPDHFFERAQAGVRGRFFREDHIQSRAQAFLESARRHRDSLDSTPIWITTYANSILEGANAVATLGGFPVAGRRVSRDLYARLEELHQTDLFSTFQSLLGADSFSEVSIQDWIDAWKVTLDDAIYLDPKFNPARITYFLQGFNDLVEAGHPEAILWHLLTTWCEAIEILNKNGKDTEHKTAWEVVLTYLKLDPARQELRSEELDRYLNSVSKIIELWAERIGL
jgi:hypothetical protein